MGKPFTVALAFALLALPLACGDDDDSTGATGGKGGSTGGSTAKGGTGGTSTGGSTAKGGTGGTSTGGSTAKGGTGGTSTGGSTAKGGTGGTSTGGSTAKGGTGGTPTGGVGGTPIEAGAGGGGAGGDSGGSPQAGGGAGGAEGGVGGGGMDSGGAGGEGGGATVDPQAKLQSLYTAICLKEPDLGGGNHGRCPGDTQEDCEDAISTSYPIGDAPNCQALIIDLFQCVADQSDDAYSCTDNTDGYLDYESVWVPAGSPCHAQAVAYANGEGCGP